MLENPCRIRDCADFQDALTEIERKKYDACTKFLKQL